MQQTATSSRMRWWRFTSVPEAETTSSLIPTTAVCACLPTLDWSSITLRRTTTSRFVVSELDVGPIFSTRPNPTHERSDPTRPNPELTWNSGPDSARPPWTTYSFAISCRILQLVHQMTFQLRCQHHRFTSHCRFVQTTRSCWNK